ncbi:MAG: YkgJ family cysteine cluster protein [Candidatus Bathyarchaeota archaeon]|nr:YkgJ family cysteine cluster protein [Candidatus Bathyarchaeum sp.]
MDDIVALITLDPKTRAITDLSVTQKQFRFKCKRCAVLCCKLGGPPLTKKDIEQIEKAGYAKKDFLEPTNRNAENLPQMCGTLKTRPDGSCIFLQQDLEQNCFTCSIYDYRPSLCRLYPFSLENLDSKRIALKIIPCCMGLNNPEGNVLDYKFVSCYLEHLLDVILPNKKCN